MNTESYTPGHSQNAADFMALRSVRSHGQFFIPHLKSGVSVLDCGCGPGSITLGIAELAAPGKVVGVDFGADQIAGAQSNAAKRGIANVNFLAADSYSLPLEESSFDRVFSHALMEHLADPLRVVKELYRVLKPDGVIGVCSPDWGDLFWRRRPRN
jgi:ubiquinone/menaquinone biosynthesis C-methylase UbiE